MLNRSVLRKPIVSQTTHKNGKLGGFPPNSRHNPDLKMSSRPMSAGLRCVSEVTSIPRPRVFVMSNLVVAMFRSFRSPALLDTVMANAGMSGSSIHLSRAAVSGDVMSSSEGFQVRSTNCPIFVGSGWGEGNSYSELCASIVDHHQFSPKTEFQFERSFVGTS